MRTRSLFTTLACTAVLAGVGAGTAFAADDSAPSQPSVTPTTTAPRAVPTPVPTSVAASTPASPVPSATEARSGTPTALAPPPSLPGSRQIGAVPSGAPNTGVPTTASDGHGEAVAVGASLAVLLGGSGTLVMRRRLKGRG